MDATAVQRCEDLWLNGGDLVIRAENTVFKVLAAILSIASPIFKDMLGVPQPIGPGAELYEGLPFVRLSDSAFDVTQFLKALIYPGQVVFVSLKMYPFSWMRDRYAEDELMCRLAVLAAVLRLGTKYGVHYLRKIAVNRLVQLFPYTYEAYDRRPDEWPYDNYTWKQGAVVVAELARECNVLAVLPCCLWVLTPNFPDEIASYSPGSEDVTCTLEDEKVYALDFDTFGLCIRSGWRLNGLRQLLIFRALNFICSSASCRSEETKAVLDDQILRHEDRERDAYVGLLDFLPDHWWRDEFKICDVCSEAAAGIWEHGRASLWERLPELYDLSPWNDLVAASQLVA
jgi:hypothetical protein